MGQLKAVLLTGKLLCATVAGRLLQLGLMGQLKAVLLTDTLLCAIQWSSPPAGPDGPAQGCASHR